MSSFSPTDAALEGVRLSRERPRAILAWAAYYFGFTILLGVLASLTLGSHAQQLLNEAKKSQFDPADFDELLGQLAPFAAIGYPLLLAFKAMLTGAIYRAILSADSAPKIRLRLGIAELRLLALDLIKTLILTVLIFLGVFTVVIAGVGAGPVVAFFGMLAKAALLWLGVLIAVRLSLAGPASFAEGRLILLRSWPLTHGQFWRLFGAYVMAFALTAVAFMLMLILFSVAFQLLLSGLGLSAADVAAASPSLQMVIVGVVAQAISSLIVICLSVILISPSAEAYRELTASG